MTSPANGGGGDTSDNENVAGGGSGSDVGELTPTLPEAPFFVEGFVEPDSLCDAEDCRIGPWMLSLWRMPDDTLQGALASMDPNAPSLPEVWPIRLEPQPDGSYAPAPKDSITLDSYKYVGDFSAVPFMCLTHQSQFRFMDDTGDGVADRVVLSGTFFTQGERGGDLDDYCSNDLEERPLSTTGRVATTPPVLHARGDAFNPLLSLEGGFLAAGSATLSFDSGNRSGNQRALPLQIGGFIYGFRSPLVLDPGSTVTWKVEVAHAFGPAPESDELTEEVADTWVPLSDSGFEDYTDGMQWPKGLSAVVVSACEGGDLDSVPVPEGARALLLRGGGAHAGLRLKRPLGPSRLTFSAVGGDPLVQLASPFANAGLAERKVICVPDGTVERCAVELESGGDNDLLVTIHNPAADFGTEASSLCIDELRLDPVAKP